MFPWDCPKLDTSPNEDENHFAFEIDFVWYVPFIKYKSFERDLQFCDATEGGFIQTLTLPPFLLYEA